MSLVEVGLSGTLVFESVCVCFSVMICVSVCSSTSFFHVFCLCICCSVIPQEVNIAALGK